jgi:hypothetical protein
LELALVRCTTAKVELLTAATAFCKALDEEQRADEALAALGATPPRVGLDRVTYAAWQVHRGQAFWDRTPAEATPLKAAQ